MTQKPLRVVIMTSGTRGDVQPFCCLALALKQRGHEVALAAEERMHSFIESFGIKYLHVAGDPTGVLFTKEGQEMLNDGRFIRLMTDTKKNQEATYEECLTDYAKAGEGADVIISGPLCMTQSFCVAEKNKAAWVPMILGPTLPTGEFPLHFLSQSNLPFKWMNKLTYSLAFWMLWKSESGQINKFRTQTLKLPPMNEGVLNFIETKRNPVINAYSPYLIPGEKKPSDWPEHLNMTGFIFPPPGFTLMHPYFEQYILNGPPPIYLGLGSMPAPNPQKLIDIATETVAKLGVRAVLVTGWTEITEEMKERMQKANIYVVDSVPHGWLLPRCSCVVHHCGVGTTAAVLRSGTPSVPVPVYLDQPFWAHRLHQLGVASEPIPFQKLTAPALTTAIRSVLNSNSMKATAKKIAADIVDGTQAAVELVENAKCLF